MNTEPVCNEVNHANDIDPDIVRLIQLRPETIRRIEVSGFLRRHRQEHAARSLKPSPPSKLRRIYAIAVLSLWRTKQRLTGKSQ